MENEILQQILSELKETRGDISELKAGQAKLEAGQAKLEAGQAKLEARQAKLEAGQAKLEAGQTEIRQQLNTLDEKIRYTNIIIEQDLDRKIGIALEAIDTHTHMLRRIEAKVDSLAETSDIHDVGLNILLSERKAQ